MKSVQNSGKTINKSAGQVMEAITDFISRVEFEDLPLNVVHDTKRMLLDSIGCAVAGTLVDKGKCAINVAKKIGGSPESTILGTGARVSAASAAFANGELINAIDMDALMFPAGHAPPMVTPAPLAMAEAFSASGKELITGLAVAYELAVRIAGALSEWRYFVQDNSGKVIMETPDVHGLGFCIFAGAAGAAKIINLDKAGLINTLGIAGHVCPVPTMAKWYNTTPNAMTKYMSGGFISQAEVMAVFLAGEGYIGDATVLDSEFGFFKFSGSEKWKPEVIFSKLGEKWGFPSRIIYKPYPCCRAMHGGLDCFINIMEKNSLKHNDIDKVEVFVDPLVALPAWNVPEFQSHVDAQFDAGYPFAVAAFRIKSGVDWQKKETLDNPEIRKFLEKVKVYPHPDYGKKMFQDPRKPLSRVEVVAKGKTTYTEEKDWKKGNPWPEKAKLSDKELINKFKNNSVAIIGEKNTKNAIELIMNLEDVNEISVLTNKL